MRKLVFFLVVYHDMKVDKEHARHDFIRQYHGKRLIVEIIRQHDNEKIY